MTRRGAVVSLSLALLLSMIVIDVDSPAEAAIITVDDSGGADYTSIQDAVNAANPGDTIFVYNGTYYENVVINKKINLTGEDRSNTIIDSNGFGDVVHVVANWVNISGFEVKNSSNSGSGIYLQSSDYCKIEYCKSFFNEPDISLDSLSNNNIIINNICTILVGGIYLDSSSDNKIINNTGTIRLSFSSNNTLTYNGWGGIYLSFSNGNRIENNNLTRSFDGIELIVSHNNIIKNNTCNYVSQYGISLYNSSHNIIENNDCSGNNGGIFLEGHVYLWKPSENNKILNNICNYNDF